MAKGDDLSFSQQMLEAILAVRQTCGALAATPGVCVEAFARKLLENSESAPSDG